MPRTSPAIEADAQQVLDELWKEKLIPFRLNVGKITEDSAEYTIHFYDSRIRTASIPMTNNRSFKALLRDAVLACVAQLGPSKNAPNKVSD